MAFTLQQLQQKLAAIDLCVDQPVLVQQANELVQQWVEDGGKICARVVPESEWRLPPQADNVVDAEVERIALSPKDAFVSKGGVSMTEYFAQFAGESYRDENIGQAARNIEAGKAAAIKSNPLAELQHVNEIMRAYVLRELGIVSAAADPSAERDKRASAPVQRDKPFDPFPDFIVTKGSQSTPKPAQPASPGAKPYPFAKFSPPDVV